MDGSLTLGGLSSQVGRGFSFLTISKGFGNRRTVLCEDSAKRVRLQKELKFSGLHDYSL
jgi:hypothetical protein